MGSVLAIWHHFFPVEVPRVPAQREFAGPYFWPDGSLFLCQGDGVTCDACGVVSPTDTRRCPKCRAALQ